MATNIADLVSGLEAGMAHAPDDIARDEGYFRSEGGYEIYWQTWEPENVDIKGAVALMHGFAEHSSRYHHVASALARAGYGVFAIDARGHGRTSGKRGFVSSFDEYLVDMDEMMERASEKFEGPLFCLAHSYGGLVGLHHAVRGSDKVSAYVFSSPFCGILGKVPPAKAFAGNIMSKVYPSLALATELEASLVSHDKNVVQKYEADPLVFSIATARWFTETKGAQARLQAETSKIETPSLWLVAGADGVVDSTVTEKLFRKIGGGDCEIEVFPDLYHEILNEPEWPGLLQKAVDWFERHA